MKNKLLNLMLDIMGLMLLFSSNWITVKSIASNGRLVIDVPGVMAITGAILILFTMINYTSIIFCASFDTNISADER